ncbi:MAG: hypothetical protein CL760_06160 [Chloroflexi bacterium]|nr:hypothetical protein [Chloroflexota bacterium]|tara:strand:+ start:32713 stop:32898 length:186 start_codon:yes stop_codon:yes gene_type:complete
MFIVIVNKNNITEKFLTFQDKKLQEIQFMRECQGVGHEPTELDFLNKIHKFENGTVQMLEK